MRDAVASARLSYGYLRCYGRHCFAKLTKKLLGERDVETRVGTADSRSYLASAEPTAKIIERRTEFAEALLSLGHHAEAWMLSYVGKEQRESAVAGHEERERTVLLVEAAVPV
jgi:hypothetical protein